MDTKQITALETQLANITKDPIGRTSNTIF